MSQFLRFAKRNLPLPVHLAHYRLSHMTGKRPGLPVNLTVSVTFACPSRCATCGIWQKPVHDLSLDEYARIFPSFEKVPIWVTLSGGDQFLRADLDKIVERVRKDIEPKIINIPMNGVVTGRIFALLPKIAEVSRGSQLVLNLSADEIGEAHDRIRGVPGNFAKLLDVAALIRDLKKTYDHIVLGVHTVISKKNVHRIPDIERELRRLFTPDSYITEVAEKRVELRTMERDITPSPEDYRRAVTHLRKSVAEHRSRRPLARLVEAFRYEYYDLAARTLEERRQIIDCYAGLASAHLAADGHVWGCCVRAESLGNVRDHDYDFGKVWGSPIADRFRASVKNKECACPLANASYTNLLLDPASLVRVVRNVVRLPADDGGSPRAR
jgi:MoaA/NifB/PqqE/SkfB family radical SAM enzyme